MVIGSINVPEDLVLEGVLPRLPVKSLTRFMSVRKSWGAVINDSDFTAKHFQQFICNPSNACLLVKRWDLTNKENLLSLISRSSPTTGKFNVDHDLDLPYFREGAINLQLLHCNGIFCLHNLQDEIVLWNPATRDVKFVSTRPIWCPPNTELYIEGVGFGYDHSTNDYKVVRICKFLNADVDVIGGTYHPCPPFIDLYSLTDDSWKELDVFLSRFADSSILYDCCALMYSNGIYHWLGEVYNERVILSFDVGEEVFRSTPLPGMSYDDRPSLAVLNEDIAAIIWPLERAERCFEIWVLGEYGVRESWTKQATIGPLSGIEWPLGFWTNGELVLAKSDEQLVYYDFTTQQVKDFQIQGVPYLFQVVIFVESLISISQD